MTQLSMTRGDTVKIDVVVVDKTGAPVNLTGNLLIFTMKINFSDGDGSAVAQKKSPSSGIIFTDAPNGKATITIAPADTRNLDPVFVPLHWDLQLVAGGDVYTVDSGTMGVNPDVTIAVA